MLSKNDRTSFNNKKYINHNTYNPTEILEFSKELNSD